MARPKPLEFKPGYDNVAAFVFLAPSLVLLIIFALVPMLGSLVLGFFEWRIFEDPDWVGIENFVDIFRFREIGDGLGTEPNDPRFYRAFGNNLFYLLQLPFHLALSLSLAMFINRHGPVSYLFRSIYFVPVVTSMVAAAVVFRWVYQPSFGLLNSFLRTLGVQGPNWLGDPDIAKVSVIGMNLWKRAGYQMLIYLAALQGVPEEYYESARIAGAGAWRQFWNITLPLIAPTTFFLLTMGVIWNLQMFPQIYVLTEGGPAGATSSMVFYIFQKAFEDFRMGYASALSLILFLMILTITVIQWRLRKRWVFGEE